MSFDFFILGLKSNLSVTILSLFSFSYYSLFLVYSANFFAFSFFYFILLFSLSMSSFLRFAMSSAFSIFFFIRWLTHLACLACYFVFLRQRTSLRLTVCHVYSYCYFLVLGFPCTILRIGLVPLQKYLLGEICSCDILYWKFGSKFFKILFYLIVNLFRIIKKIHFIDANNQMRNLQQRSNKGMSTGLL